MAISVAGIDGCPGGWAVVEARVESDPMSLVARFETSLRITVERLRAGELAAVAVDMPIGLLDVHPRPADVAARALLGARRSSVFPTPLRVTLLADDYHDACARSRALCGKALSKQAWHLVPKIRHIDALIRPSDQDRFVECHPELAFTRLNEGKPLDEPKTTSAGRETRIDLLETHLSPTSVAACLGSGAAPATDLVDAMALVTTARRVAAGTETRLAPIIDPTGLRAEIVV